MVDRIRQVIEYSQLSSSTFADTIGISRSGLTHLLTGRNQPSLDVARKILAKFPEISTEWLIMGMGEMLRSEDATSASDVTQPASEPSPEHPAEDSKKSVQTDLFGEYPILDDSEEDVADATRSAATEEVKDEDVKSDSVEEPVVLESVEETEPELTTAPDPEPVAAVTPSAPVRAQTPPSRPRKNPSESRTAPARRERQAAPVPTERKLRKIVFFYDDHSFEVFNG